MKMVLMTLCAGQQWRCRDREHTCGHGRGRRGCDELGAAWKHINYHMENKQLEIWKIGKNKQVEICCMMQGAQIRCSVTTREVRWGEREVQKEGTYVCLFLIHVDVWQRLIQHCKAIKIF